MDWPPLIVETQRNCLRCLLGLPIVDRTFLPDPEFEKETFNQSNVQKAIHVLCNTIRLVKHDKVVLEGYLHSKEIDDKKKYKSLPPHMVIWNRIKKTYPLLAPQSGDRLRYAKVKINGKMENFWELECTDQGVPPCRITILHELQRVMDKTLEPVLPVADIMRYFEESGKYQMTRVPEGWFLLGKRKINEV